MAATINKSVMLNEKDFLKSTSELQQVHQREFNLFSLTWNIGNAVTMHNELMMIFELIKETGFP